MQRSVHVAHNIKHTEACRTHIDELCTLALAFWRQHRGQLGLARLRARL